MSTDRQNELPDDGFVAMLGELNVDPLELRQTPTLECTIQIWKTLDAGDLSNVDNPIFGVSGEIQESQ